MIINHNCLLGSKVICQKNIGVGHLPFKNKPVGRPTDRLKNDGRLPLLTKKSVGDRVHSKNLKKPKKVCRLPT
jgi:hypothetical protein